MGTMPYLVKRKNSLNWKVRFQYPDGKSKEQSLGTSDKREAERKALKLIDEHKAKLIEARPRKEMQWCCRIDARGLQVIEERDDLGFPTGKSERAFVTEREITFLDEAGQPVRVEPNGGYRLVAVNLPPKFVAGFGDMRPFTPPGVTPINLDKIENVARPAKRGSADDDLFEAFMAKKNRHEHTVHAFRKVYQEFRTKIKKPLADVDRADAEIMAKYFAEQGVSSSTVRKKFVPLVGLYNFGIAQGKLKFNPFANLVTVGEDVEERVQFDDYDMKLIAQNLDKLDEKDQPLLSEQDKLLIRVLASTGLRRGEAFQIKEEHEAKGVRYVRVGSRKGKTNKLTFRNVPLPTKLLQYLPAKITKPLFTGDDDSAGRRLSEFLRDVCEIKDPRKVVHSFRHRVASQLGETDCPVDRAKIILGHAKETHDVYRKHSLAKLLEHLDKIDCGGVL